MPLEMGISQIRIQEMHLSDLDEVLAIETSSSPTPWSKYMFITEMSNPLSHCFVAEAKRDTEKMITGFLCFRNMEDESELLAISVHPRYRRLGIGKELMRFYMKFCRGNETKRAYLEVCSLNQPALHLYHLFSFHPVGIRKRFYRQQFDALLMMKEITHHE